ATAGHNEVRQSRSEVVRIRRGLANLTTPCGCRSGAGGPGLVAFVKRIHVDIGEDATGVLVDNDLLLFADLAALWRRDYNVASFGGTANYTNNGQTVAEARAQAFVVFQKLFLNLFGSLGAFFEEALFFFLAFGEDVVKFVLLVVEVFSAFGDEGVGLFYFFFLRGDEVFGFFGSLLADLDFQFLKLYFLGDGVEFAVISDVFLLLGVFLD